MTNKQQTTINQAEARPRVRLTVDVSPELNATLTKLAQEGHITKSEILRRAITLMEVAVSARERGQKIALVDQETPVNTEIVGVV